MKEHSRRDVLAHAGVLAVIVSGLSVTRQAVAANPPAFEQKTLDLALSSIGGKPVDSKDIVITSPDIAENGAVVPIAVTSKIPQTEEIYILVEKNPFPLAASFAIPAGTDPYVSTRVKMGESTNVWAVVKAGGKFYSTSKETKVTLGGCGG